MLTPEQREWIETHAGPTFRLTSSHTQMLRLALDTEKFSFRQVGYSLGVTREAVHLALRNLERRGVIRLRRAGPASLTRTPHTCEPGPALQAMFDAFAPQERMAR